VVVISQVCYYHDLLMDESELGTLAAGANVTINVLDGRGLYTASPDATERATTDSWLQTRREEAQFVGLAMADLANATGGTFFHNSNDMDAGFKSVMEVPEVVYELELSLDGVKADGIYHRLNVKVDRKGVEVTARPGYFMPKPQKTKK
jgi:VWFA-related protein